MGWGGGVGRVGGRWGGMEKEGRGGLGRIDW